MEELHNINSDELLDKFEFEERIEDLVEDRTAFDPMDLFKQAWEIFKSDPGPYLIFTLVVIVASALSAIPIVGFLVTILMLPLNIGFAIVTDKYLNGEAYEFRDFFGGYQKFGELLGVGLLVMLLTLLGFAACVLPGVYLAVAYLFASSFVYFNGVDIWTAMEGSRKLITPRWFEFFVFGLLAFVIMLVGAIACGIGVLVAIPVISIATHLLYRRVFLYPQGEGDFEEDEYTS